MRELVVLGVATEEETLLAHVEVEALEQDLHTRLQATFVLAQQLRFRHHVLEFYWIFIKNVFE